MSRSKPNSVMVTKTFFEHYGRRVEAIMGEHDSDQIVLISDEEEINDHQLASVEIAVFSRDSFIKGSEHFFQTINRAENLRWLHVFHAGVNGSRYQALLDRGITLTSSAGSHAEPIAQTAMAALLWFARPFAHWQQAKQERRWARIITPNEPRDLRGQTLVVFGVGAIGRHACRIAKALGLHVIGVRRSPLQPEDEVDELHHPSAINDLLPRADWLMLSCALTEQTRGLIDEVALDRLPNHAYLLNVSRGAVVDEEALILALQRNAIAGAYLDVFQQEPLSDNSPLWDMPQVLLTPHNSSVSNGNDDRVVDIFLENFVRRQRGEKLVNHVVQIE